MQGERLQQVGLSSPLADANRKRPQEILELFGSLYQRFGVRLRERFAFRHRVYSLDATVIDLCLNL